MRNEISYYPEILNFIRSTLRSNFVAADKDSIEIYWGRGELKANLKRIIAENPRLPACIVEYTNKVQPLDLDVFALITDGKTFEIVILEVKLVKSVGLKEWSQLIGYCLVSDAKYGLLINIDNGCSSRLFDILQFENHLSEIVNLINGIPHCHFMGFMQWNSVTQNFEYTNLGYIRSLSMLSKKLINDFDQIH
jgi:hypothetical protein